MSMKTENKSLDPKLKDFPSESIFLSMDNI